jgi:hypothetical protein
MAAHLVFGWILAILMMPIAALRADSDINVTHRDKTGTNAVPRNTAGPQTLVEQALASLDLLKAEGKGLEPSTPCGATDFESVS